MRCALGLLGLALALPALAQEPTKTMKLSLTVEQAALIVQTLGQIGCQKVADMANCDLARETLRSIQDQAKAQGQ